MCYKICRRAAFLLTLELLLVLSARSLAAERGGKEEIDTQFIFGFTEGTDIGKLGEKELEQESIAQFGKRGGSYLALSELLRAEFVPVKDLRFEFGVPVATHDIAEVPSLSDRHQVAFDGLIAQARYRLLDREHAPFALTLNAEPHWSRTDEMSGQSAVNFGGNLAVALDKELAKNVFGALNFVYDPEITHSHNSAWQREATLGAFASITFQVQPGGFLGLEARELERFEGFDLNRFAGRALFLGPTMFLRASNTLAFSGAWDLQVTGHARSASGSLDLTNFTRHAATFRLEYNF